MSRDSCIRAITLAKGDIVKVGKSRWQVERAIGVTSYLIKAGTKGRNLYTLHVTDVERCCLEVREVFPGSGDLMPGKSAAAKGCLTGNHTWAGSRKRGILQKPMTRLQKPPRFSGTGRRRALGRVDSYGPNRSAIFYVGQKQGVETPNRAARCRTSTALSALDRGFLTLRIAQVGKQDTRGTRTAGKGWYQGSPEPSAAYEVIYIPNAREKTYAQFRRNMNKLAEKIGQQFCQDSVIVIHNNAGKRTTCGATWFVKGPAKC